ncbi:MAG: hypothetical protein A3A57_02835 [Candidatus Woykebacteria bacterium RIFCSPLOWO2_01_FULL_41_12]|uniref:Uncharacterized protein n=1 Tax=Candidatus Woykebacteria bacterium RIFCSPLOWO2_01_FULL_41_12 TaxID=1802604 RepID=A0A1G1WVS4_9BACT|nr:MAG: hypothetical protein A3A57_02835 [Candidatus Woykebacteria bacterium RIFCSPLOWO2_01_FULL_41_12]
MTINSSLLNKLAPKDVILISLLIILVPSVFAVDISLVWLQVVVSCSVAIASDITLNFLKKTKFFFPKAGLITGLIIALVLPLSVNPLIALFASLIAILSKQLIRLERHHIFNPATFGLVASGLFFKIPFGWWGDSIPWLVILLGIVTIIRAKKELQTAGFIVTYVLVQYLFLRTSASGDLVSLKIALGTIPWFFAFFMVPEPMTSLFPYRLTPLFGFIAALAAINLSLIKFTPISNNSLLLGLLLANLVAFGYFYLQRRETKAQ